MTALVHANFHYVSLLTLLHLTRRFRLMSSLKNATQNHTGSNRTSLWRCALQRQEAEHPTARLYQSPLKSTLSLWTYHYANREALRRAAHTSSSSSSFDTNLHDIAASTDSSSTCAMCCCFKRIPAPSYWRNSCPLFHCSSFVGFFGLVLSASTMARF